MLLVFDLIVDVPAILFEHNAGPIGRKVPVDPLRIQASYPYAWSLVIEGTVTSWMTLDAMAVLSFRLRRIPRGSAADSSRYWPAGQPSGARRRPLPSRPPCRSILPPHDAWQDRRPAKPGRVHAGRQDDAATPRQSAQTEVPVASRLQPRVVEIFLRRHHTFVTTAKHRSAQNSVELCAARMRSTLEAVGPARRVVSTPGRARSAPYGGAMWSGQTRLRGTLAPRHPGPPGDASRSRPRKSAQLWECTHGRSDPWRRRSCLRR